MFGRSDRFALCAAGCAGAFGLADEFVLPNAIMARKQVHTTQPTHELGLGIHCHGPRALLRSDCAV